MKLFELIVLIELAVLGGMLWNVKNTVESTRKEVAAITGKTIESENTPPYATSIINGLEKL